MSLHILWRRGPVLIARGRARQSRPVSGVAGENDFRTLRLGVLRQKSDHAARELSTIRTTTIKQPSGHLGQRPAALAAQPGRLVSSSQSLRSITTSASQKRPDALSSPSAPYLVSPPPPPSTVTPSRSTSAPAAVTPTSAPPVHKTPLPKPKAKKVIADKFRLQPWPVIFRALRRALLQLENSHDEGLKAFGRAICGRIGLGIMAMLEGKDDDSGRGINIYTTGLTMIPVKVSHIDALWKADNRTPTLKQLRSLKETAAAVGIKWDDAERVFRIEEGWVDGLGEEWTRRGTSVEVVDGLVKKLAEQQAQRNQAQAQKEKGQTAVSVGDIKAATAEQKKKDSAGAMSVAFDAKQSVEAAISTKTGNTPRSDAERDGKQQEAKAELKSDPSATVHASEAPVESPTAGSSNSRSKDAPHQVEHSSITRMHDSWLGYIPVNFPAALLLLSRTLDDSQIQSFVTATTARIGRPRPESFGKKPMLESTLMPMAKQAQAVGAMTQRQIEKMREMAQHMGIEWREEEQKYVLMENADKNGPEVESQGQSRRALPQGREGEGEEGVLQGSPASQVVIGEQPILPSKPDQLAKIGSAKEGQKQSNEMAGQDKPDIHQGRYLRLEKSLQTGSAEKSTTLPVNNSPAAPSCSQYTVHRRFRAVLLRNEESTMSRFLADLHTKAAAVARYEKFLPDELEELAEIAYHILSTSGGDTDPEAYDAAHSLVVAAVDRVNRTVIRDLMVESDFLGNVERYEEVKLAANSSDSFFSLGEREFLACIRASKRRDDSALADWAVQQVYDTLSRVPDLAIQDMALVIKLHFSHTSRLRNSDIMAAYDLHMAHDFTRSSVDVYKAALQAYLENIIRRWTPSVHVKMCSYILAGGGLRSNWQQNESREMASLSDRKKSQIAGARIAKSIRKAPVQLTAEEPSRKVKSMVTTGGKQSNGSPAGPPPHTVTGPNTREEAKEATLDDQANAQLDQLVTEKNLAATVANLPPVASASIQKSPPEFRVTAVAYRSAITYEGRVKVASGRLRSLNAAAAGMTTDQYNLWLSRQRDPQARFSREQTLASDGRIIEIVAVEEATPQMSNTQAEEVAPEEETAPPVKPTVENPPLATADPELKAEDTEVSVRDSPSETPKPGVVPDKQTKREKTASGGAMQQSLLAKVREGLSGLFRRLRKLIRTVQYRLRTFIFERKRSMQIAKARLRKVAAKKKTPTTSVLFKRKAERPIRALIKQQKARQISKPPSPPAAINTSESSLADRSDPNTDPYLHNYAFNTYISYVQKGRPDPPRFEALKGSHADFGSAVKANTSQPLSTQSDQLILHLKVVHASMGIAIPDTLTDELKGRGEAPGVSLLRDVQRVNWHYTHVPNAAPGTTAVLGKEQSAKIFEDLHHPDIKTLFVYSDANHSLRRRASAAGIHIAAPVPVSQTVNLGTSMSDPEEAELAGLYWSLRFTRSWLESEEGKRAWAKEGYDTIAFVTDATASIHYLSGRIFYKRDIPLQRLRVVAECRIEAAAISRLAGGIHVNGLWVPRDFNEEMWRAHNLSEAMRAEIVWTKNTSPQQRQQAMAALHSTRWKQLAS